ncbi:MAG: hypothetical protein V1703_01400 [Candidatus Altiarchaeota archaeon]
MRKELSQKEVEELSGKIEMQYGFRINSKLKYFLKDEKEGEKIFLYTGSRIPKIPAEWVGLHYGTIISGLFQPSIDGAWLMKTASKNVVETSRTEIEELMRGGEIENKDKNSGYVLLKAGELFCVGIVDGEKIKSTTPKSRRI